MVTRRLTRGDGQGRVNLEIVARALARGHFVSLVTEQADADLRAHPYADWVPLAAGKWPTDLARSLVLAQQATRWLKRHRHQIDVLHVNGGNTWVAGDVNAAHFVHSAWLRSPVHVSRLERNLYGAYQDLNTRLNAAWERPAFQNARAVVAVSERVRQELLAIGVADERLRVIVNGVNLHEFFPGPARRDALGLPENVPLALFAGDIRTPRKNLDTVLKALALVPNLHLAVVGATDGSPFPALAETLGVAGRVRFLGYRRDMPDIMRAADFFVFPSRYEPFSLVLLEAMASGLPVVTARCVGAATLVGAGGIVVDDAEDVDALAHTLQILTEDPVQRAEMGRAGRQTAEQHSWEQMADNYLSLYEELYSEKTGGLLPASVPC